MRDQKQFLFHLKTSPAITSKTPSNRTRTDSCARRIRRIHFFPGSTTGIFAAVFARKLFGAAPTGPSVSVPISQLNSDPQAHLIIRMSKKQQQKPRTVQTPSQFNLHHQAGRNLLQKLLQESIYTEEGLNALLDGPANANRQFGTLISQMNSLNLNQ